MGIIPALALLSSGLFLGWNLGANGAANILGSAVGSRMLSFRRAAVIGAVFVVLGSAAGSASGSGSLGSLGTVGSMEAAFALALSAALTVLVFTRMGLPVSTSQAVVGAIIGLNFYNRSAINLNAVAEIVLSWIASPILAGIISAALYLLLRILVRRTKIHLFHWDNLLRFSLGAAGAYGSFSLGMNNIANVMGVFVPVAPFGTTSLGPLVLSPVTVLYITGGIAIAAGILTYSRKVMDTLGTDIVHLSPENALAAVLAVSTVLLLFSSPWLPRVPVSSSQAAVGAVIGIGLMRGLKAIRFSVLGRITLGWVFTPAAAAAASFLILNIMKNVFGLAV
jgi:PiT family inorganic phosphate transporter